MSADVLLKPNVLPLTDVASMAQPRPGVDKATPREAARMFEGMILTQMFQAMRKTVQTSDLFGKDSETRSTYEYLLDQAVVEHAMAAGKGLGLADSLEKTWSQSQGDASTLS